MKFPAACYATFRLTDVNQAVTLEVSEGSIGHGTHGIRGICIPIVGRPAEHQGSFGMANNGSGTSG